MQVHPILRFAPLPQPPLQDIIVLHSPKSIASTSSRLSDIDFLSPPQPSSASSLLAATTTSQTYRFAQSPLTSAASLRSCSPRAAQPFSTHHIHPLMPSLLAATPAFHQPLLTQSKPIAFTSRSIPQILPPTCNLNHRLQIISIP